MRPIIAAIAAALTLAFASSAHAYVTFGQCHKEIAWPSGALPSTWKLNSAGSADLDLADLEKIFEASFGAWSGPCCSSWKSKYLGTTNTQPMAGSSEHVIGFTESNWPSQMGNQNVTIAVTLPQWNPSNCAVIDADMLYNGVGFKFIDGLPKGFGNEVDLQSVATHECGHWLGLDHSPVGGATMFASYSGGTGERSLSKDDESGVCYLYPGSCTCTSDAQCGANETCASGACVDKGCTTDAECGANLVCSAGKCVTPPCQTDADCGSGFKCEGGSCKATGDCPICQSCQQDADCGPNGRCVSFDGTTGVCTVFCFGSTPCPGDSACFGAQSQGGQVINLCLNEDAPDVGPCPGGYVCAGGVSDPCQGITCPTGQECQGGKCVAAGTCDICESCQSPNDCASGMCISFDGVSGVCSQSCESETCPLDSACQQFQDQQGGGVASLCVNPNVATAGPCKAWSCGGGAVDPCATVKCAQGTTCVNGQCVGAGQCDVCEPCQSPADCAGGQCISFDGITAFCSASCETAPCPGDSACVELQDQGGNAFKMCLDPASASGQAQVPCQNFTCNGGNPTDPCQGVACPPGQSCQNGQCVGTADPCAGVLCPPGQVCQNGTCTGSSGEGAEGSAEGAEGATEGFEGTTEGFEGIAEGFEGGAPPTEGSEGLVSPPTEGSEGTTDASGNGGGEPECAKDSDCDDGESCDDGTCIADDVGDDSGELGEDLDAGGGTGEGAALDTGAVASGCSCAATPASSNPSGGAWLLIGLAGMGAAARRRRQSNKPL